jgi:hypothetical protein
MLRILGYRKVKVFFSLHSYQLKFENLSPVTLFPPRINKMKNTVVRPNALFDFSINPDSLGITVVIFMLLGR